MGAYQSLFRKEIKLRDSTCDVSCISTNIQDGGQPNQNMSRNKADRLLYLVLESLLNETMKIFVAISLQPAVASVIWAQPQ